MKATHDSGARRVRYGSMTLVLVGGMTICLLFLAVLLSRVHARWDATATREHSLSSRTLQVLASLQEHTEIVVSVDTTRLDARSRQRIGDVLAAFTQASDLVQVTTIDVGSGGAAAQIEDVAARSSLRHGAEIAAHREAIDNTARTLADIETQAPSLADALESVGQPMNASLPVREKLLECAAMLRGLAGDAQRAREGVAATAEVRVGDRLLPDLDAARSAASGVLRNVGAICDRVVTLGSEVSGDVKDKLPTANAKSLRDRALVAADAMDKLPPLEPLMIVKLLRGKPAVLVVSSSGVQALDQQSLFPTTARIDAAGASGAQIAFAGEEVIAGALGATSASLTPIVVFVHADKDPLLDARRRPTPAGARIARLVDRLAARRIDVAEWAVAQDAARPNLATIDPERKRPVVWFVLGAPSRLGESPRGGQPSERTANTRSLAAALEALVNSGEHLLIAMEPSEMPAIGDVDPMLAPLAALGVQVDTARPIVERLPSPTLASFSAYQTIRSAVAGSDVAKRVGSVATMLQWPMPIRALHPAPAGVNVIPLLRVEASPNRWAESQWLAMRYLNVNQPLKTISPRDPPTPGDRDDANGPWDVAVGIERARGVTEPVAGGRQVQRVILVASPSWYEDQYTELATTIEGRRAAVLPGNRELLDASIAWLAGLDEQFEGVVATGDVARIAPLSQGTLRVIRWGLIAGMPGLVLVIGLILRWRADRAG